MTTFREHATMTVVLARFWSSLGLLPREHWQRVLDDLDPATDYERIVKISTAHEFGWDTTIALSLALFRTFAVPSIGGLLHETGEFTRRPQKRYDDTALILDAIAQDGIGS